MREAERYRAGMGPKLLPLGGLLLLCVIWAVGWVRADLYPGVSGWWSVTPMLAQAAQLGVLAAGAGVASVVWRVGWPAKNVARMSALVGTGLFVVPAVLASVAKERIDDAMRVALFSLTPLFAVIFEPHLGVETGDAVEDRSRFPPAMTAIVGTFLVFPVELPRSYTAALVMLAVVGTAASVAAANCAAVRLVRRSASVLAVAALAAGFGAVVLGTVGLILRAHEPAVPVDAWAMTDLFSLALLFWLMRRMSAVQMTTRFVIAPLLANLISLALMRPQVGVQSWIGLGLIAVGAGWMLFARADKGDSHVMPIGAS